MIWLRKKGAAHSVAFHNVHDAAILWFSRGEPRQVDATLVRQGTVSQISTVDRESIERAREVVEGSPWVPVVSEGSGVKWDKFVNVDRVTDVVLEDDPPPGSAKGVRKLVLSVTYIAPGNPFQPQSYLCGEIHERSVIDAVLDRLGHAEDADYEIEALAVESVAVPARRAKRKARGA
jgi:hypothetical protein